MSSYMHSCIAPDSSAFNTFILAGITDRGVLELTLIKPDAQFNQTLTRRNETGMWGKDSELRCDTFVADQNRDGLGTSLIVQQFDAIDSLSHPTLSSTTVFLTNGSLISTQKLEDAFVRRANPRLYSMTGASGGTVWYTSAIASADGGTGSRWFAAVVRNDGSPNSYSYNLSMFPSTEHPLLLSVGTFTKTVTWPTTGYLSVFDTNGGGTTYLVISNDSANNATTIQTLSEPRKIDMNGITLTHDAYAVTMTDIGFIVDRASNGATTLYSIQPTSEQPPQLKRVNLLDVPPFYVNRAATSVGRQLILYGGQNKYGIATDHFHVFDHITQSWSGPGLVAAPPVQTSPAEGPNNNQTTTTQTSTAVIVSGAIAGMVMLALGAFFIFRRRRRFFRRTMTEEGEREDGDGSGDGSLCKRASVQASSLSVHLNTLQHQRLHQQQFHGVEGDRLGGRDPQGLSDGRVPLLPVASGSPQSLPTQNSNLRATVSSPLADGGHNQASGSARNPQDSHNIMLQHFDYAPVINNPQYIPPPLPLPPQSQRPLLRASTTSTSQSSDIESGSLSSMSSLPLNRMY